MASLTKYFDRLLLEAGYEETGGGRNFISYEPNARLKMPRRIFYVFGTVPGSGPDDSHWVEVDKAETIIAGGFTVDSLQNYLKYGPPPLKL